MFFLAFRRKKARKGRTPGTQSPPAVLKILRVINLLRVVFLVRHGDLLSWRNLCGHHSPGNYRHFSSQRSAHGAVNLGGVVKTLRHSPRVCKRWFPNGGSSFMGERNSATPPLPQFFLCFTSILPLSNLFLISF